MAMIKCEECGKEISDSAKTCPHCGKEIIGNNLGRLIFGIVISLISLWLFISACISLA